MRNMAISINERLTKRYLNMHTNMNTDMNTDIGTLPLGRLLLRFAAPAFAGMLSAALYNVVDRIFVGQMIGRDGLAAIALVFPAMLICLSLAMLVGIGTASRVSIMLGEQRPEEAESALGTSLALSCLFSAILVAAGYIFCGEILIFSGASARMLGPSSSYLRIVLIGLPFAFVSFVLSNLVRAAGAPNFAMGTQLIGAVANIALDALFVVTFGMGIDGAAVATVLSQIVSCAWAAWFFFTKRSPIRIRARCVKTFAPATIRRILSVGAPSGFVEMNFALVNMLLTYTIGVHGGDLAVSATGIYTSLDSLLFLPALSIGEACMPIIGFNYGAGKLDRVLGIVRLGLIATTAFYIASFALIMFAGEGLVSIFVSDDAPLTELAVSAMRISNCGIAFFGLIIMNASFHQGLGRGREAMIASGIRYVVFMWLPLIILPRWFGVYGAWASYPISDICGGLVAAPFMIHQWKAISRQAKAAARG